MLNRVHEYFTNKHQYEIDGEIERERQRKVDKALKNIKTLSRRQKDVTKKNMILIGKERI